MLCSSFCGRFPDRLKGMIVASMAPWGAMRFVVSFIGAGIMDRYRDLRVGILECDFGWLPCWTKRMDEQVGYVGARHHSSTDRATTSPAGGSSAASRCTKRRICLTASLAFWVTTLFRRLRPWLVEPEAGDTAKAALRQRGAVLQADLKRRHPARQHQRRVSRRVKREVLSRHFRRS